MNNNANRRREDENTSDSNFWLKFGAAAAGAAAVGTGLYYLTRSSNDEAEDKDHENETKSKQKPTSQSEQTSDSFGSNFVNFLHSLESASAGSTSSRSGSVPPEVPNVTNLNSLLDDIYRRYISLNDDEVGRQFNVFNKVFLQVHEAMKNVDPYYKKYSSNVLCCGSHYDNIRIRKMNEYPDEDVVIVIGLPLNMRQNHLNPNDSDVLIEAKSPGYVQLKMGTQFQNLLMRDGAEWLTNKTAYGWKDDKNYLKRSAFRDWFKSTVNKALNNFRDRNGKVFISVEGVPYEIRTSESGPAMTLLIRNTDKSIDLDVDLVPALKFPESRWPVSSLYRDIPPQCRKDYWMVVAKQNKAATIQQDVDRSWRIVLFNQERQLLHNTNNLRQAIRFIKRLRDVQGMNKIASYFIKSMFLREVVDVNDQQFWSRNNPATLFKLMVKRFHAALVEGNIPYFWNRRNNLLEFVDKSTLTNYAARVAKLIAVLDSNKPDDYKLVAQFLLTPEEYLEYKMKLARI